jgi:hypothetical protein
MNQPVPRRRQPWGAIWAKGPWDGKPVEVDHPRMPATLAAPVTAKNNTQQSRRRQAFGFLLQSTPWAGHVRTPEPDTTDTLNDFRYSSDTSEDTALEIA